MNFDFNINTEALSGDIEKIKKERENLINFLEGLKKNNNILRDYWETRTSEEVFENFNGFYKYVEEIINDLDNDCKFLSSEIIESHTIHEEKAKNTEDSELRAEKSISSFFLLKKNKKKYILYM